MSNPDMTFNWKMKQNNKMTVIMFSPDNFKNSVKPQRIVAKTQTPTILINQNSNPPSEVPGTGSWELTPSTQKPKSHIPPPFEKMISAPGNLQQFVTQSKPNQPQAKQNINQFVMESLKPSNIQSQPSTNVRRHRRSASGNKELPPPFVSQRSTPSMLSLVSPINRNRQRAKAKLNHTKKQASTSDLNELLYRSRNVPNTDGNVRKFTPPPLISRNSESSLLNAVQNQQFNQKQNTLPSLFAMVSGSPSNSPIQNLNYQKSDSDTEMCDVERQTSKMSISNLIG